MEHNDNIFVDFLISAVYIFSGEQITLLNILTGLDDEDDVFMKFETTKQKEGKVHKIGDIYYLYLDGICIKQFTENEWKVVKPFIFTSWDDMIVYYSRIEKLYFNNTFNKDFKKFVKDILVRFRKFIENRILDFTLCNMDKNSYYLKFSNTFLYGKTKEEIALSKTHKFESLLLQNKNISGYPIENSVFGFNYYLN